VGESEGGCAELLLSRGSQLEVWSTGRRSDGASPLQCEATFSLQADIESLAVLRRRSGAPRTQRDALLLATREAKLSVLEWDPATRGLRTSSLHRWEGRAGTGQGDGAPATRCTEAAVAPKGPRVLADPEGRCAAVLLGGGGEVAVLPAVRRRRDSAARGVVTARALSSPCQADDSPDEGGGGGAARLGASFVLDLRPRGVRSLRCGAFLSGYAEPTLLLLHEAEPTWAGRLALRRDSCALAAFSISLAARRATRIWADEGLPSECSRCVAVPSPAGGALVLASGWLLYRCGAGPGQQLALRRSALGTADAPPGELAGFDGGLDVALSPVAPPAPQRRRGEVR
jgi:cleavage and polyadenylation specificity factor subunit 1